MSKNLKKLVIAALSVAGIGFLSAPAVANPQLVLPNLDFLSYSGNAPKDSFTSVNPDGWTGGSGLIYIVTPGNSSVPSSGCGAIYLTTYGCPSTLAIAGGYNAVEADGNPDYEGSFNYTLTGLTAGQTYTLSFYQAASQQLGFPVNLPTTEQWIVSLGTAGLSLCANCGPVDSTYGQTSTYFSTDAFASIVASPLMTTPGGGLTDWNYVSVDLTADAETQIISFLAWGDNGSTVNLPPIVFLTGVNAPPGLVPEPATLSIFGAGVLGALVRRRMKRKAAA